jgi:hypothetical protein
MTIVLELPAILDSGTRFQRDHKQWVKDALRREMVKHHKKRIPGHFKQSARSKYKHKPRKRRYMAWKRKVHKSARDLVMTGLTEKKFRSRYDKIEVGGGGKSSAVHVKMTLKWPFDTSFRMTRRGGGSRPKRRATPGVTLEIMNREMEAFTEQERNEINESFKNQYFKLLNAGIKPLVRKRIVAAHPGVL